MLTSSLLSKFGFPALLVAAGFIGGITFQATVLDKACPTVECPKVKIPECPDCNCPPTLGNEFDKIKTKGRSNLTLNLHNNYTTACDSANLRDAIREAVNEALQDYSVKKKKR